MLAGPSTGREQRREVLEKAQGLVRRPGFLAQDSDLNVLHLAECGLREHLLVMEQRHAMSIEQANA